jgi:dinuclear metal center YbgI/SA1388 family protein
VGYYSVGDIEDLLFKAFPATDALPNDRNGLFVGDRKTIVKKIAIALDQTVPMVEAAAAQGCNLLVTHHPPFIYAPDSFLAASSPAVSNGAVIYKAAQKDVALLNMHTNLDCAPVAASMLLEPVGLEYTAPLRPHGTGSLGQLAKPKTTNTATGAAGKEYLLLGELAERYRQSFGSVAKVWGDTDKPIFTVAACSGGAGEVVSEAIAASVDCFVTGEVRHHEALYLADAGISLIELGHDNSELPYRNILQDTLVAAGIAYCDIVVLSPSAVWWQPDGVVRT